jgi:prolipoprotein diacylglyceryltransferase
MPQTVRVVWGLLVMEASGDHTTGRIYLSFKRKFGRKLVFETNYKIPVHSSFLFESMSRVMSVVMIIMTFRECHANATWYAANC